VRFRGDKTKPDESDEGRGGEFWNGNGIEQKGVVVGQRNKLLSHGSAMHYREATGFEWEGINGILKRRAVLYIT